MKRTNPFTLKDGKKYWEHQAGDYYAVTGVTARGKRFSVQCSSWAHARGVNVYKGNKWLVRNGRRRLIQSISN